MTRPFPPRLPELAGMTEAGLNRVVAMIQWQDFVPSGTFGVTFIAKEIVAAEKAWKDWRASLPKTRNKKQRKKDRDLVVQQHIKAKFFAGRRVKCAAGCGTVIVLDYVSGPDTSRMCTGCEPVRLKAKFEGGG